MHEKVENKKDTISRGVANSVAQNINVTKHSFGFVDNRENTNRSSFLTKELLKSNEIRSTSPSTLQGRFFNPIPDQGAAWNTLLDNMDIIHGNTPLPNKADIDTYIQQSEIAWYGDDDHNESVVRFNAFVTLKGKVKAGLEQLKLSPNDSAGLNWGDIVDYLINDVGGKGFLVVNTNHGALGGGHGRGWFWNAVGVTTGTVPDAAHGLNDAALGGARGSVRTVIIAHNALIENEKTNW